MKNEQGTATIKEKTKWIEALESGEYNQGHETLRSETGYCCLGVYLTIKGEDIEVETYTEEDRSDLYEGDTAHYERCSVEIGNFKDEAVSMNDRGKSFKEIATAAREYYGISVP
jgi:hypothetical protein